MTKNSVNRYGDDCDDDCDCILYELLLYSEWKQEPEVAKPIKSADSATLPPKQGSYLNIYNYLRKPSPTDDVLRLLNSHLPWKFAVGEDGKVVAILQDTLLEIRASRDEYSSVVGKAVVCRDPVPQWRKMLWSPDCSMLAVAYSSGDVAFYNLLGSNMFCIKPEFLEKEKTIHPLTNMLFLKPRIKSKKWAYEFIIVDYKGNLNNYLVSPTDGFEANHTFSFASHYCNGVTAVSYHPSHNLLFVAGITGIQLYDGLTDRGSSAGLSGWRLLNDHPYYQLTLSNEEEEAIWNAQRSFWSWVPVVKKKAEHSTIFRMQVSPKGKLLVCLHSDGAISVWHLPGIRLFRYWNLHDQPDFSARNPQLSYMADRKRYRFNSKLADLDFYPVDANWWSEKAVIIARHSGAVSVCSVRSLNNLLGESPEFLAGPPQVSALCNDRGFLGLECEMILTSKKLRDDDDGVGSVDTESSDDEEESSLLSKSAYILRSGVYMITDIERFQPRRKKPKLLYRTYRLLGLKSTTPEELYARKIDNEEYGEALALAKAYNLDCDLVYQRQWRNSSVSIATIHDYLSKITKRSWVLRECIERVPESFAAARELLEFGLKGINLETVVAVGEGIDGGHFILQHPDLEYDDDDDLDATKSEKRKNHLLRKINPHKLNNDQKELLKFRILLLHYLDMLRTYEIIMGGPHLADSLYDSSFYQRFRSTPLIVSVVEFAREGNCEAVQHMFTYHGSVVLPHWLPVLSSFPETMDPVNYQGILPECGVEGGVVLIEQAQLRKKECFEDPEFRCALDITQDDGSTFLYEEEPDLKQFQCPIENLEPELITKWYRFQVHQLESRSGIVDHALNLLNLGKERNVVGLEDLFHDLKTLDSLVYEINLVGANLSNLKSLSDFEKAKLLMSKTSEETFVNDIKHLLLPFLERCEKQSEGIKMKLLGEYLVDVSSDNLKLPYKLFEYLLMEPNSVITADTEEIINLGFTCIYASPDPDQLDIAEGITTLISKQPLGSLNDLFPKIRDKLHELQRQLTSAKILRNNGIPKAVSYIRDIANNAPAVKQLLSRLARSLAKRISSPSKSQWEQLLNDILTLQEKVFKCIPTKECYEIYAETLLSSGDKKNIAEASTILECRKSAVIPKMVSFDRSVKLVLQVAREYFDSSGDLLCPAMELAKACLQLIVDETEEIQEQLDLISSLQILSDFNLSVLPLQVRQCEDRMQLIKSILYKDPYAYQRWEELLLLAHKLRVCGRNRHECEGRVLTITAQSAYEAEDFKCCAEICKNIVDNNHGIGWQVVQQLGQCREFSDVQQRCDFLSFAVLHCEPDMLDKLLTTRCLLEAQVLHKQLSSHIPEESVDLTSGDEEEFSDALTSPMTPKREFPPVLSIMNVVEGSTEVIRKTTYQLLKNVGNKNFWKDALSWVQIGNYNVSSGIDDNQGEPLSLQAVPQFYRSLFPECRAGVFDPQYDDFFLPDIAAINPALELCRALLRITLLEGAAGDGPSRMDTTAVLLQLAKHLLPEDTTLGLAHLLLVPDINRVKDCLDSLPATAISIQIACYYCALTGYSAVYGCQSEKMAIGDMFLYNPSELISHMVSLVENSRAQGVWTEYLIQSQKTMSDFLQGQRLNEFGCGIDLKRFAVDKQYQQDSILGLPMTVDTKRFQLAVTLGSKHGISVSQIAAIHACALLLNTEEITVTEQIKRLNDPQLLELLRKDPDGVCERFQNYVYPSIGGTQHNMLVLYYTVLSSVAENKFFHCLLPKDHIKLLKKIKATSPAIDYKLLVETPNKFLDAVRPAMRKENVGLLVKLLKSLPVSMNCTVQPGAIYGAWAATEFFQVSSSAYALGPRLWLDQFRMCSHYFTKMAGADVVNFAKAVCFSEKSIDVMTVDCRISLLHLVKEYTDGKKKENHGKEWAEASSTVDSWISHLNQINSYHLEEINGNSSPELQLLLRQLDLSRGEPDRIKQVFKFSICSSVPLKTLEGMMKVFPQPCSSVESMLEDQLNESISGLRNGPAPESLALLPHILHRLQEVADDRGCSLVDPWAVLEPLCYDESLPPKLRLQSVNFLEKNVMPSGARSKSLLLSRIRAVVDLAWSHIKLVVCESDFSAVEAEISLFHKLLATAESWQQLKLLKNVLDHWQTFQDSTTSGNKTSDPWMLLLYKILHFKGEHLDSVLDAVEEVCKGKKFNEMSLQHLILQSQETVDLSLVLAVCLCSEHASLHDTALFLLRQKAEMGEVIVHQRVMTLLLRRGLAPDLVDTPIYQQLEQHLLAGNDKQLPPIFAVVAQLEDAGHLTEARALSHRAAQLAGHQRGGSLLSGAVKLARRTWSQKK
ncbi:NBAS subunit of NRZ tethering complex-like isoform X2 [Schistocerca piceifrons]|uniref:NBAS subunit of NRZ tethering complex-like isoform X2 n=1 Tax=Schistocerca piceifrons TaxID=274613 RepID=UPI001F5EB390|nr:NBAS subunit of NRZ tethering complex-like isoform X2 [Schistocerca piceifrons]